MTTQQNNLSINFKTPVTMKVTWNQYVALLRDTLLDIGYDCTLDPPESEYGFITTSTHSNNTNSQNLLKPVEFLPVALPDKFLINEFDPSLFLAIAAMTYGDIPNYHEHYISIKKPLFRRYKKDNMYIFKRNCTNNKRYFYLQSKKSGKIIKCYKKHFKKASVSDIIYYNINSEYNI